MLYHAEPGLLDLLGPNTNLHYAGASRIWRMQSSGNQRSFVEKHLPPRHAELLTASLSSSHARRNIHDADADRKRHHRPNGQHMLRFHDQEADLPEEIHLSA